MKKLSFTKFNSLVDFFAKNISIVLLIVVLLLTFFVRLQSLDMPYTDAMAKSSIDNGIRNQIQNNVNIQYPNLPDKQKNVIITDEFNKFVSDSGDAYDNEILKASNFYKDNFRDENGVRYLTAIDPYFYLRHTKNLVETGDMCDTYKDGVCWNTYTMAPTGKQETPSLHTYFSAYTYKFIKFFNPGVTLEQVFLLIPLIVITLSMIPLFFLVKYKLGSFGAFVACMFTSFHALVFGRTNVGFTDTDGYVILFMCLTTWLFFKAFNTDNILKQLLYGGLSGLSLGLFAFAWAGWWYIFDIIVACSIGYMVFVIIYNKSIKMDLLKSSIFRALIAFIFFSMIFVPMFSNHNLAYAIEGPIIRSSSLNSAAQTNYWPNIQTTVAELGDLSVSQVVNNIGLGYMSGKFLMAIALLGVSLCFVNVRNMTKYDYYYIASTLCIIILLLLNNIIMGLNTFLYLSILLLIPLIGGIKILLYKGNHNLIYGLLLTLWFIASIYASTKGTRFVLLLVPAFSIGIGFSMGWFFNSLKRSKEIKFIENIALKRLAILFIGIVLSAIVLLPLGTSTEMAQKSLPSMNDAWAGALNDIKINSSEDAIINSWWDFGHWFKYMADRRVTVDGAGQHYQLAYWMGTVLSTNNQTQAINTLRMLDCKGIDEYSEVLAKNNNNVLKSVYEMQDDIQNGKEYCTPPENYLITSEDMVGKAPVWGHFGNWNFDKAYWLSKYSKKDYSEFSSMLQDDFNMTKDEASKTYSSIAMLSTDEAKNSWISDWPRYYTNGWSRCSDSEVDNESVMVCPMNLYLGNDNNQRTTIQGFLYYPENLSKSNFIVSSYEGNILRGKGILEPSNYIIVNDTFTKFINKENNITIDIDVIVDFDNKRVIAADPKISDSMFTHLYFLDGKYTDRFEKFTEHSSPFGNVIKVWKVRW